MICQILSRRLKLPGSPDHCFVLSEHSAQCVAVQCCCSNQARLAAPHLFSALQKSLQLFTKLWLPMTLTMSFKQPSEIFHVSDHHFCLFLFLPSSHRMNSKDLTQPSLQDFILSFYQIARNCIQKKRHIFYCLLLRKIPESVFIKWSQGLDNQQNSIILLLFIALLLKR